MKLKRNYNCIRKFSQLKQYLLINYLAHNI